MTGYITKCGKTYSLGTGAAVTGNRNMDGCEGCPYLMPYGPMVWNPESHHYEQDVRGMECRVTKSIRYDSRIAGKLDNKSVVRIYSLDLDFLESISAWVEEYCSDGELSGKFDRTKLRPADYDSGGQICYSIYPAQNRKGVEAKTYLWNAFFNADGSRAEITPEAEKEKIMNDIKNGIAAVKGAEECKEPQAPAETGIVSAGQTAAAAPAETALFDYSGLDAQTVEDLRLAENEVVKGRRMTEMGLRRMADGVAIAHEALCGACDTMSQARNNQHSEKTFGAWCDRVGVSRKTAERLLQVSQLYQGSTPTQQKVLEELSPTLLYAAAKPSAPAELVQAVKDGDITSHKQYQFLLGELKAAKEKEAEAVEYLREKQDENHDLTVKLTEANEARRKAENDMLAANRRTAEAEGKVKTVQRNLDSQKWQVESLQSQLASERERSNTYKQSMAKLDAENRELKSRPVEVAVQLPSEAEIKKYRKEGYQEAAKDYEDAIHNANKRAEEALSAAANAIPSNAELYDYCDYIGTQLDYFANEMAKRFKLAEPDTRTAAKMMERMLGCEQRFRRIAVDILGGFEPDIDDDDLPD